MVYAGGQRRPQVHHQVSLGGGERDLVADLDSVVVAGVDRDGGFFEDGAGGQRGLSGLVAGRSGVGFDGCAGDQDQVAVRVVADGVGVRAGAAGCSSDGGGEFVHLLGADDRTPRKSDLCAAQCTDSGWERDGHLDRQVPRRLP